MRASVSVQIDVRDDSLVIRMYDVSAVVKSSCEVIQGAQ